ncbi:MAG: GAF domain-containing protein, partial [Candidatus Omnitrophica bacterium]|nr:GAF domain-containing protein [Candidatus Omnitrophota bacterium]
MTRKKTGPLTEKSCPADKVRNLQKILRLNSILNSTLELDRLLAVIMKTSAEVMRTEVASLLLIDEETKELVFRVALGGKGSALEERFRVKMGEGIAGTVAKNGKPLVINNAQRDPRFAKRFDASTGFITRAILCVPLQAKGKVIGVLQAINPLRREGFCLSDLDLFETFAHQAAIAIENAKLHTEIVRQEIGAHMANALRPRQTLEPSRQSLPGTAEEEKRMRFT